MTEKDDWCALLMLFILAVALLGFGGCQPPTKPVVAAATPQPTADIWAAEKHAEALEAAREAADRTFDELRRDIAEDMARINHMAPCIENETKTYYDCTRTVQ